MPPRVWRRRGVCFRSLGALRTDTSLWLAMKLLVRLGPMNDCDSWSDVIIFCIALHTGMCVLHFKRPWARLGLEPHHRIVRVVAILYPVTMASLAFVNGKSAYVAQGSLCALPVRPFWYRLALSWIPRYLILTFIMAVSVATYTFVATSFRILSDQLNGSVSTLAIGSASFCGPVSPNDHVLHRHRAIQKELRLTFIYPVVYFLMWVPSFVNHCFGYSTKTPPFVLNTVALVCQLLQCATDCVVFNLRERPWRVKPLKRQVRTPFHHVSPVQQWWDREWADISSDDDCETSSQ